MPKTRWGDMRAMSDVRTMGGVRTMGLSTHALLIPKHILCSLDLSILHETDPALG